MGSKGERYSLVSEDACRIAQRGVSQTHSSRRLTVIRRGLKIMAQLFLSADQSAIGLLLRGAYGPRITHQKANQDPLNVSESD